MSLDDALKYAQIDELEIPVVVRQRWKKSPKQAGFTVAQGEGPERFSGKATLPRIMERLRIHPQARRLLAHKQVIYMAHGARWGARLEPPKVAPGSGSRSRGASRFRAASSTTRRDLRVSELEIPGRVPRAANLGRAPHAIG